VRCKSVQPRQRLNGGLASRAPFFRWGLYTPRRHEFGNTGLTRRREDTKDSGRKSSRDRRVNPKLWRRGVYIRKNPCRLLSRLDAKEPRLRRGGRGP